VAGIGALSAHKNGLSTWETHEFAL